MQQSANSVAWLEILWSAEKPSVIVDIMTQMPPLIHFRQV